MNTNIYITCPEFDTGHFHLRLVRESDAEDLLRCYSDPAAQKFFNSDNCTSDFLYSTAEEMRECVQFWIIEYKKRHFIRFATIDKITGKVVGTVEIFGVKNWDNGIDGGCLRIDVKSEFEKTNYLSELIALANDNFFTLFGAELIAVKAIPEATERIAALKSNGYVPYELSNPNFTHFYAKTFHN